jgi:TRAP-type C4-dicarboxylate transport system permease small subunit
MSTHAVEMHRQLVDAPEPGARLSAPARALQWGDKVLGMLCEVPAALLVLAEILVLFSAVVSRYVLHSPLVWADEMASLLFIWLIMFGAAVAFRRGSHMRMTALVDTASPGMRSFLEVVATVAAMTWLALVAHPACEFASEEAMVTMPALDISNAWRASALPIGIGLILVMSVLRLLATSSRRMAVAAVVACGAIVAGLVALQPVLQGLGNANLLVFFVVIVGLLVFTGVPIAFSFGLATFGYLHERHTKCGRPAKPACVTGVWVIFSQGRRASSRTCCACRCFSCEAVTPLAM